MGNANVPADDGTVSVALMLEPVVVPSMAPLPVVFVMLLLLSSVPSAVPATTANWCGTGVAEGAMVIPAVGAVVGATEATSDGRRVRDGGCDVSAPAAVLGLGSGGVFRQPFVLLLPLLSFLAAAAKAAPSELPSFDAPRGVLPIMCEGAANGRPLLSSAAASATASAAFLFCVWGLVMALVFEEADTTRSSAVTWTGAGIDDGPTATVGVTAARAGGGAYPFALRSEETEEAAANF